MACTVIAVTNQKGGVGKTTTVWALADALRSSRGEILAVDIDPQCNLSYLYGASSDGATSAEIIDGSRGAAEAVQSTPSGDMIASSELLASASRSHMLPWRLREKLDELREGYRFIIIDTPPALGPLTINALTAADFVMITAAADVFSLQGIGQLRQTIEAVRTRVRDDEGPDVYGILVTRYSARINVNRIALDMLDEAAADLGASVLKTRIRECAAVREAQMLQKRLSEHAPRCTAAVDYRAVARGIIERSR